MHVVEVCTEEQISSLCLPAGGCTFLVLLAHHLEEALRFNGLKLPEDQLRILLVLHNAPYFISFFVNKLYGIRSLSL